MVLNFLAFGLLTIPSYVVAHHMLLEKSFLTKFFAATIITTMTSLLLLIVATLLHIPNMLGMQGLVTIVLMLLFFKWITNWRKPVGGHKIGTHY